MEGSGNVLNKGFCLNGVERLEDYAKWGFEARLRDRGPYLGDTAKISCSEDFSREKWQRWYQEYHDEAEMQ